MSIDRNASLEKADQLLKQGKLQGAIQEYVRLAEDQPEDWNVANALGDLYARAGDAARAVAQFTRVADHLFDEGFYARAAALYKKALRMSKEDDRSLFRLSEIAARQGRVADARTHLVQLEIARRARGDQRGATDCAAALAALDNPQLKAAGSRGASALGALGSVLARDRTPSVPVTQPVAPAAPETAPAAIEPPAAPSGEDIEAVFSRMRTTTATTVERLTALYELAGELERVGDSARALAVLLQIDAEADAYRDVPARIERLTRARAEGAGR